MSISVKNFFVKWWAQLVVVAISLGVLFLFKDQAIIAGGDSFHFLDFGNLIDRFASTWYDKENLGISNISLSQISPTMLFWAFFKFIGVAVWLTQRLWFIVLSAVAGLSMFYLITYLFQKRTAVVKIGAILGSTLYLYNMFIVIDPVQANYRPIHAFLPLLLLIWMKGLNKNKFDYRLAIVFGLVTLLSATSYNNIAAASIIPIVLGLYLVYHLATKPKTWKRSLAFAGAAIGNFLLFNLWWIITSLVFMLRASGRAGEVFGDVSFVNSAQISDAFRFLGFWAFETTYNGIPLFSYSQLYTVGFLVLTTLVIAIVIFAAVLKRQLLRSTLFFLVMALLGMFFIKGANEPFGQIFEWMYQLPDFWAFREPFTKFTPLVVLAFAVLLGLSVTMILSRLRDKTIRRQLAIGVPIIIVIFALILVNAFPLLTGQAIWDIENQSQKSLHATVPDYWNDLDNWLEDNDSHSRIFLLPRAGYGHAYDWESGVSSSGYVAVPLLPNPVAGYPAAEVYDKDEVLMALYEMLESDHTEQFAAALRAMGFKYVLQQNDLDWQQGLLFKSPAPQFMKQQLDQVEGLELAKTFGKLDLYHITGVEAPDMITVTDRSVYTNGDIKTMLSEAGFADGALLNNFYIASQIAGEQRDALVSRTTDFVLPVAGEQSDAYIDLPRAGEYQLSWQQAGDEELIIGGSPVALQRQASNGSEIVDKKLVDFELVDPLGCDSDSSKMMLRYNVPDNLALAGKDFEGIFIAGEAVNPINVDEDNHTVDLCLNSAVGVVGVSKPWAPLAEDSDATDIYESRLDDDFTEGLTTSAEDKPYLAAYFGNDLLTEAFEEALADPGSVDIGHIDSNRVVVMVPAGEVPGDNFSLYYLKRQGDTGIPTVTIRTTSVAPYLESRNTLELAAGQHRVNIPAGENIILTTADYQPQTIDYNYDHPSQTKYEVGIGEHSQEATLILRDSYNVGWQASVSANDHWQANGYANSWPLSGDDSEVTIKFAPQRNLVIGVIILIGYGIFSIYFLWRYRRPLGLAATSLEIADADKRQVSPRYMQIFGAVSEFGFILFSILILGTVFARWAKNIELSNQLAIIAFLVIAVSVIAKFFTLGRKSGPYQSVAGIVFGAVFRKIKFLVVKLVTDHWPVLIILLLGLASQVWFRENLLLAGGDNFLYIDPGAAFDNYLNTAMTKFNGGIPNSAVTILFPFLAFWKGLGYLGLSTLAIQKIWLYLMFTLPGVMMYILILNLSKRPMKIAALVGGALYMANIFIALDVLQITIKPIHAFLPLLFLLWMKGLQTRRSTLFYAIAIGITSIFFASSAANIAVMGAPALILLAYAIYFFITHRRQILSGLKFIGETIVAVVLVNIWWLIVTVPAMLALNEQVSSEVRRLGFEERTHLVEVFRLMGFWAFKTELEPSVALIPYADNYYQLPLVIITFAIPAIAFLAFVLRKRLSWLLIFFGFLAIAGLFLIKGVNAPFGAVYQYLRDHISAFWIFREPYTKFMLVYLFALSVLFGISIQSLSLATKKLTSKLSSCWARRIYWLIPAAAIIIVVLAAYPIFTGQNIQDYSWYNNPRLSLNVKVPSYWNDLEDWMETNDPDSRVALFPKASYGHSYYWNSGMSSGNYIADVLLPNPTIRQPNIQPVMPTDNFATMLYSRVNENDIAGFNELLDLLHIKYVLQQDDLAWDHAMADTLVPEAMNKFFESNDRLAKTQAFGKLVLYEYKDYDPDKAVTATTKVELVGAAGGETAVQDKVLEYYDGENAVLVQNIFAENELRTIESKRDNITAEKAPPITTEQVSPTRYLVTVTGDQDFFLQLNTTWLKNWQARVLEPGADFNTWADKGLIPANRHVMTNAFANGWFVTPPGCIKSKECGDSYQIVIDYKPQNMLYLGLIISGATLVLFVVYLVFIYPWQRRKRRLLGKNDENTSS